MDRRFGLSGLLIAACVLLAPLRLASAQSPASPLRVFAAVSLKGPLDQALADWRAAGGAPSVVSYAATPALVRQIQQGAPADVFLSADVEWMDQLQAAGALRPGTRRDWLANRLVLVAPAARLDAAHSPALSAPVLGGQGSSGAAFTLAQASAALGGGRVAIGEVNSVPAGRYARAALDSLGLWPLWSGRLAMTENVRVALALVARGEAALGIVYASDAVLESKVRVIALIDSACHPPIRYPAAVLAGASHPRAPEALAYLAGPAAGSRFTQAGFQLIAVDRAQEAPASPSASQTACSR